MRRSTTLFIVVGLAVAFALVLFVAPRANQNPDGLEKVAADHGLDAGEQHHDLADSPLADYGVRGIDNASLSTAMAGVVGVLIVFAAMYGIARLAAAATSRRDDGAPPGDHVPAASSPPTLP